MDKETFQKLNLPVNGTPWRVRVANVLNNAELFLFIEIYKAHLRNGGYGKKYRCGLMRYPFFGKKSLAEVEQKLEELELPKLQDAARVVKEFDALATDPVVLTSGITFLAEPLVTQLLRGFLQTLGKKHDPETVRQIMAII